MSRDYDIFRDTVRCASVCVQEDGQLVWQCAADEDICWVTGPTPLKTDIETVITRWPNARELHCAAAGYTVRKRVTSRGSPPRHGVRSARRAGGCREGS
jgi:hypothetical protein